jgi:hypothetical protein
LATVAAKRGSPSQKCAAASTSGALPESSRCAGPTCDQNSSALPAAFPLPRTQTSADVGQGASNSALAGGRSTKLTPRSPISASPTGTTRASTPAARSASSVSAVGVPESSQTRWSSSAAGAAATVTASARAALTVRRSIEIMLAERSRRRLTAPTGRPGRPA